MGARTAWLTVVFALGTAALGAESASPPKKLDDAIVAAATAVREAHLIKKAEQCYVYRTAKGADSPKYFEIDVRENHRHQECDGDPATEPHLFTVRVSKETGEVSTDFRRAGHFKALRKPKL